MRRPLRTVLIGLMVVLPPLSGCTGRPEPPCGADGRGPVTFATTKSLTEEQWKKLKDRWHHQHPKDKLTIVRLPKRSDEQRAQLAATLQIAERSSTRPYDVVELDIVFVPEFVRAGYLHPLDPDAFPRRLFLDKPWDVSLHDGRLHALPFTTNVGLLYYWADELRRFAKIDEETDRWTPDSWDDVHTVAKQSWDAPQGTRDGVKRPPTGYAGQLTRYEGLMVNSLEVISGAEATLRAAHPNMTEELQEKAKNGVDFLLDGLYAGWIDKKVLSYDEGTSLAAFRDRRVLVLRHWPSAWTELSRLDKGPIGVTSLPPGSNVLGGENVAVAACSRYRTTAQDLLTFLTGEQTQRDLFNDGLYLPTRTALYGPTAQPPRSLPKGLMPLLLDSVRTARLRPQVPDYLGTSRLIQDQVHERLKEAVPPGPPPARPELPDELADVLQR